jgi:hypothetical protein|tara:strand:- start:6144 stop:6512 length:369 start_codon:yes stop_codon:yes gene_type:complete
MKNKIGSYINNLMTTIRNTEEQGHLRQLALEELKNLNDSISGFIFEWIDDIEPRPVFDSSQVDEVEHQYFKHWTCSICGEHTHEVDYDYLSGTDHLGCVLKKEEFFREKENNQLEINFGEEE